MCGWTFLLHLVYAFWMTIAATGCDELDLIHVEGPSTCWLFLVIFLWIRLRKVKSFSAWLVRLESFGKWLWSSILSLLITWIGFSSSLTCLPPLSWLTCGLLDHCHTFEEFVCQALLSSDSFLWVVFKHFLQQVDHILWSILLLEGACETGLRDLWELDIVLLCQSIAFWPLGLPWSAKNSYNCY